MKTSIIRLESFDNYFSIIDRLNWNQADRILLVWPKRGRLIENEVEMGLIKRQAEAAGAQVAIVCRSPGVKDMAVALELPVFQSVPLAEKAFWYKGQNPFTKNVNGEFLAEVEKRQYTDTKKQPAKVLSWIGRWFVMGLSICALLALVVYLVPGAKVVVYPQTREKTITISIWASPQVREVNVNGNLPLSEKQVEVSGQISGRSTGLAKIPAGIAEGKVLFTNLSNSEVQVPKGTITSTGNDPVIRFATLDNLVVPPAQNGAVFVQVKALQGGSSGNLGAGQLSVIESNLGSTLSVTNTEPMQGGTDEMAPSPTENDYQTAKTKLVGQLAKQAEVEINTDNQQLIEGSLGEPTIVSEVRSVDAGQPGQEFTLSITARFAGSVYASSNLSDLVNEALKASLATDETFADGTLKMSTTSNPQISSTDGSAKWQESVTAEVESVINSEVLVQNLRGKRISDSVVMIERDYPSRKTPQVTAFPSFWKWMPLASFRIQVGSQ